MKKTLCFQQCLLHKICVGCNTLNKDVCFRPHYKVAVRIFCTEHAVVLAPACYTLLVNLPILYTYLFAISPDSSTDDFGLQC